MVSLDGELIADEPAAQDEGDEALTAGRQRTAESTRREPHVDIATDVRTEVTNDVIAQALGKELRRARETRGWTRIQLIEKLPVRISEQTLLTYEHGQRHCTFVRLVEICRTLGVTTPDLVHCALQRAGIDLEMMSLRVDLRAIIDDSNEKFRPIRRWAIIRLSDDPDGTGIARLIPEVMREMAAMVGCSRSALVKYLAKFTPEVVTDSRRR
jgi:transcriptional regulator with XRE-family HTH domain